jgi:hypothetical protein
MPYVPRFEKTDVAALIEWIDAIDFSDRWERNTRLVTDKGVYILSITPVTLNNKPLRFDKEAADGSNL